jgi:hypothetical protein
LKQVFTPLLGVSIVAGLVLHTLRLRALPAGDSPLESVVAAAS